MQAQVSNRSGVTSPAVVLGALTLLIHLAFNAGYGAFSDEMYFIICGQHPAFGYVDQPPLIPLIAATSYAWFGLALLPLRFVPALAMALTVALSCAFARGLGGGRFAQWLAGLAVLTGGVFLVDGLLLTTDCLQPLAWLACSWCLVRVAQTDDERWWLAFGAIAGVSLESKYLIAFYAVALLPGLIATPLRRSFLRPWIYLGALLAFAMAAPNILWQAQHGWPFLEQQQHDTTVKNSTPSPLGFLLQQILFVGPAVAPIWLAGLWHWSTRPALPALRVFPIAFAVLECLFFVLHGKTYYIAPIFPVLLVAGALALERWLTSTILRSAIAAAVALIGAVLAPLTLPILSPAGTADYARALGLSSNAAATEKQDKGGRLPLHLAGQIGWREMTAKVAAVYKALPTDERAHAVFYGRDYGEAAAATLYGPALGGPPVVSAHNNFYLWGPGASDGSVVIVLGHDVLPLFANYRDATPAGRIDNPFAEPWEAHLQITVLRHPRAPLKALWPQLKYFE